jgi:hypothetical protein
MIITDATLTTGTIRMKAGTTTSMFIPTRMSASITMNTGTSTAANPAARC